MTEPVTITTSDEDAVPAFDAVRFWSRFRHATANVDGVRLHYVEGGAGPPVLLLPGWPQSWYAWRHVMPGLVDAGNRVVALDPRGMGDSDRPAQGYDMTTVAAEVHRFAEVAGLLDAGPFDLVGHDLGTWIAYALATDWPGDVRTLAVFDAAIPGVTPPPVSGIASDAANVKQWHFHFNRLDDLPELLVTGRERAFLTWLFKSKAVRRWAIGPADIDEYVRSAEVGGTTRASASYYRVGFGMEGLRQSRARAERRLTVPVLAFGAEAGVGDVLFDTLRRVADDVRGGVLADCGHYVPEEAPRAVLDQLRRFHRSAAAPTSAEDGAGALR